LRNIYGISNRELKVVPDSGDRRGGGLWHLK